MHANCLFEILIILIENFFDSFSTTFSRLKILGNNESLLSSISCWRCYSELSIFFKLKEISLPIIYLSVCIFDKVSIKQSWHAPRFPYELCGLSRFLFDKLTSPPLGEPSPTFSVLFDLFLSFIFIAIFISSMVIGWLTIFLTLRDAPKLFMPLTVCCLG